MAHNTKRQKINIPKRIKNIRRKTGSKNHITDFQINYVVSQLRILKKKKQLNSVLITKLLGSHYLMAGKLMGIFKSRAYGDWKFIGNADERLSKKLIIKSREYAIKESRKRELRELTRGKKTHYHKENPAVFRAFKSPTQMQVNRTLYKLIQLEEMEYFQMGDVNNILPPYNRNAAVKNNFFERVSHGKYRLAVPPSEENAVFLINEGRKVLYQFVNYSKPKVYRRLNAKSTSDKKLISRDRFEKARFNQVYTAIVNKMKKGETVPPKWIIEYNNFNEKKY